MSTAEKFVTRYTVSDHQHWEGHWELIEGIAVSMSPSPFGPHERAVSCLSFELKKAFESNSIPCEIYTGLDWIVSDDTIVRPDVMVVCGEQPKRHLEKAPVVAIEVLSPSTRQLDIGSKRRIYKDNGVQTYLIVDVEAKSIEVNEFIAQTKMDATETCKVTINEIELKLSVSNIFR